MLATLTLNPYPACFILVSLSGVAAFMEVTGLRRIPSQCLEFPVPELAEEFHHAR
jgi:hypothetical protein